MGPTVTVTVKREDEAPVYDLKLPVDLPAGELSARIARELGWERGPDGQRIAYRIEAHPPERCLDEDETLADAGVGDGSWLVLKAAGLNAQTPEPKSIYVWKQIDEG